MGSSVNRRRITTHTIISPIAVLIVVFVSWLVLYSRGVPEVDLPQMVDGISDARGINFEENVGEFPSDVEFYPLKLYTPDDFLSGETDAPYKRSEIEDAQSIAYGTHRLKIQLMPNTHYAVCGYSIDYGTRVYANGYEVFNVGVVSDDFREAVPSVNYMEFPVFADGNGIVELIFQYSNFVHAEGGGMHTLYISTPTNINNYLLKTGLPTYILSGGFLLLATYHLLDGILRSKKISLQLSLSCLLFALRDQWFYIVSILPFDYDWYIHYRVVVAIVVLTPIVVLTLIEELYSRIVPYIWTYLLGIISFSLTALLLLVPTQYIAPLTNIVPMLAVPYAAYLIYKIIKYHIQKRIITLKDIYTLIGIVILLVTTVLDTWFSDNLPEVTRGGITPIGMVLFVIMLMSVLALQSEEDQVAFEKSKSEKKALETINDMKTSFLQKMAHEIKTPLTVMSGYAQITDIQIANNETTEETSEYLKIISSEAKRLSELVSNLIEIPSKVDIGGAFNKILVDDYLRYCTVISSSVLEKNNNVFKIKSQRDLYILGNMEMLIQLMLNLVVNSNKHMKKGEFAVEVTEQGENIEFLLSDTGSGIKKEYVDKIFDTGFSTDGTKGLGLSICKEIAEFHKGEIVFVPSETGAKFKFTVPKYSDEKE